MKRGLYLLLLLLSPILYLNGQHSDANIFGDVQCQGEHIPFVTIHIEGTTIGTATDVTGHYMLIDLEPGTYTLRPEPGEGIAHASEQSVTVSEGQYTEVVVSYDSGIR